MRNEPQTNILWLSRHPLTEGQTKALKAYYGEGCIIMHDAKPFATAAELVDRVKTVGFNDLAFIVAPLPMLFEVLNSGYPFGYFEMESKRSFEGEKPIPIVKAIWEVGPDFRSKVYEVA